MREFATVQQRGSAFKVFTTSGENVTSEFYGYQKKEAFAKNMVFVREAGSGNKWKMIPAVDADPVARVTVVPEPETPLMETKMVEAPAEQDPRMDMIRYIHEESIKLRPQTLILSDLKWKTLIRTALRGDNIMLTGPAGSGKTQTARTVAATMDRPFFYFNMGSMQDARSALIGNLHFSKDTGTYLSESEFITAIQTPNALIMLDEISRSTHDAWNILMTVLDKGQRYVRIDEQTTGVRRVINVHESVCFVATANIGLEYTATRVMDKAFIDRFKIIEIDVLTTDQEFDLLKKLYPDINTKVLRAIAEIVGATRNEIARRDSSKISNAISTRMSIEMASMLYDGFTLAECAEVTIYPFYPNDGTDSERVFVSQVVQKNIPTGINWDNLFIDASKPASEPEPEPVVETPKEDDNFDFFTIDDIQS